MNEEIPGEELPKGIHKLKSFKVIIIGDSNVGKTCLSFRFCEGRYPKTVESTIGVDFRERKVKIGPEEITLQLWDTAGQERFRQSMVPHYYRNADAAVFVYDVTRISTLESLPTYISECERLCSSSLPRILVGNKCDLSSNIKVKTQMAQEFADKYDMPVFETSAKEDSFCDHVDSIFTTLALKLGSSQPFKFPSLSSSPDDDGIVVIGEKSNEEEENWCC